MTTIDANADPLYAGILIGGTSRRMGTPKHLLPINGTTLVERMVAEIEKRVERVVLIGDGSIPSALSNLTRLSDVPGIKGPLAGILAAMRWNKEVAWIFLACDLLLLRGEAIDWLIRQRMPSTAAILPMIETGRIEPLLALYETTARPLLEDLAAAQAWSLQSLVTRPRIFTPAPPSHLRDCWTNVNTPEELQTAIRQKPNTL